MKRQLGRNVRVPRSITEDEGRPLGVGLHELASNRPKRLVPKGTGRER